MICVIKRISAFWLLFPALTGILDKRCAFSQELYFQNYNVDNGLPSSEVHDIYQDSKGYLWFATDNGISKFDGDHFYNIDTRQGLPENGVFNFFEQSPHSVWIATKSNRLYCFNPLARKLTFAAYPYNDTLVKAFSEIKANEYIRNAQVDSALTLYVSFLYGPGLLTIDKFGRAAMHERTVNMNMLYTSQMLVHLRNFGGKLFVSTEIPDSKIVRTDSMLFRFFAEGNADTLTMTGLNGFIKRPLLGISDFEYDSTSVRIILGRYLFTLAKSELLTTQLHTEGLRLTKDGREYFIASFKGMSRYDSNGNQLGNYLEDYALTEILVDKNGGIWASTLNGGVMYCKVPRFYTYTAEDGKNFVPRNIEIEPHRVICSTEADEVLVFDRKGNQTSRIFPVNFFNDFYLADRSDLSEILGAKLMRQKLQIKHKYYSRAFEDSLVADIDGGAAAFYFPDSIHRVTPGIPFTKDHCVKNDTTVLIATKSGLFECLNFSTFRPVQELQRFSNISMQRIVPFNKGFLILTGESDLIYLQDTLVRQFNEKSGLPVSHISDIFVKNDSVVWLGTANGLLRLTFRSVDQVPAMTLISTDQGLISNEVLCLNGFKDTIWAGTKKGIVFFDESVVDDLPAFVPSFLHVDSIRINGVLYATSADTIYTEYGDQLSLHFRQNAYYLTDEIRYEYRVLQHGTPSAWQPVSQNELNPDMTTTGYTTISIRPCAASGADAPVISVVVFVSAPFWMRWWFYLLIVAVLFAMVYLSTKVLIQRKTRKKEEEIGKLKLEMSALLSQMNPHFTFNTMNSIQAYIINHSRQEAVLYLSDFALLIRKTLDFSRTELITLREELEFLKLYTGLENKRFKNSFEVQFKLTLQQAPEKIKIPPLLLQPIVENSLIHGISGLSHGVIKVEVREGPDFLEVFISDNGSNSSPSVKVQEKQSVGMIILQDRIKLHNRKRYKITDFVQGYDAIVGEKGWGTIVKLYK